MKIIKTHIKLVWAQTAIQNEQSRSKHYSKPFETKFYLALGIKHVDASIAFWRIALLKQYYSTVMTLVPIMCLTSLGGEPGEWLWCRSYVLGQFKNEVSLLNDRDFRHLQPNPT